MSTTPNIRQRAVDILTRADGGAHADDEIARAGVENEADARLMREIVLGTLTWRALIDHHLDAYLRRPLSHLKRPVRNLLRSGAYQILYLDRVPAYAVVSECVTLARRHGKGVSGLVNAVLRGLAEGRKTVALPDAANPAHRIAVEHSHPEWLVRRWLDRWGPDRTAAVCEAGNVRPPVTIRANTGRISRSALARSLESEGIATDPVPELTDSLRIPKPAGLFSTNTFGRGEFFVQGPGAARVSALLDPRSGDRMLDVCAAPGGKALAAATHPGVTVVASDLSPARLRTAAENRDRLRLPIQLLAADARALPFSATFDHVLVDAPCTGLGTLARHPEIRWHRGPDDITRMAAIQAAILDSAARAVSPGGVLLYTTCTTEPEENEQVVENFLSAHPAFGKDTEGLSDPVLTILPDPDGTDGAFGARLRRAR